MTIRVDTQRTTYEKEKEIIKLNATKNITYDQDSLVLNHEMVNRVEEEQVQVLIEI